MVAQGMARARLDRLPLDSRLRGNDEGEAGMTAWRNPASPPEAWGGRYAAALCATPFSVSKLSSSPDWNISVTISQPPTNSPLT